MQVQNIKMQPFANKIQFLWSCETMLIEKMPELIENATSFGLKQSLALHLAETKQQKVILEFIAKQLELTLEVVFNPDLKKLLEEGDKMLANANNADSKDQIIISGSVSIEEFEIGNYIVAAQEATQLGLKEVALKLNCILQEEKQSKTKLEFISKNIEAFSPEFTVLNHS
jgi:ferritin-like metal-binding protein YciE